ncbi:MAG: hypothetical protein ACRCSV_03830 [Chlamydiales bacterium]
MLFHLLTRSQNALIDQGSKAYQYYQNITNHFTKELFKSFCNESRFYLEKSFYMIGGRVILQVLCPFIYTVVKKTDGIFNNLINVIPKSIFIYDNCEKIVNPWHDRKLSLVKCDEITAEKKLETIRQADNTEANKGDRLQQTLQNAKDSHAHQLGK